MTLALFCRYPLVFDASDASIVRELPRTTCAREPRRAYLLEGDSRTIISPEPPRSFIVTEPRRLTVVRA